MLRRIWRGYAGRPSTCPGRDLPGQLDGLLRTSLPGKTVTGQDPASRDRLDLFQRGQGPVVILVHEPGEQLRPGLAMGQAERRQRVAHDQRSEERRVGKEC